MRSRPQKAWKWTEYHKGLENEQKTTKGLKMNRRPRKAWKWTEDHKRLAHAKETKKISTTTRPPTDLLSLIISEKACACQGDEEELHRHTAINWPLPQGDPSQFDQRPHTGSRDQQHFVLVTKLVVVLNLATHCTELSWANPFTGAGQAMLTKITPQLNKKIPFFEFYATVLWAYLNFAWLWIREHANLNHLDSIHRLTMMCTCMYVCMRLHLSVSCYIVRLWKREHTNLNHLESVYRLTITCACMYVSTS